MRDLIPASCSAICGLVDLHGGIERSAITVMSSRFPTAAFQDSRYFGRSNAAFASAPMRFKSQDSPGIAASESTSDLLIADARLEAGRASSTLESIRELLGTNGRSAVSQIRGDFAFIYWNDVEQRLIAARDHMGIRPLYYSVGDGCIALSNSFDAMLEVPWVRGELRAEVVGSFILEGGVRDPRTTMYRDVQRLLPGHVLQFDARGLSIERYWRMPIVFAARRQRFDEVAESFFHRLRESVAHACADGPVAISLSGGMDSTSIASIASWLPDAALQAFTVGSSSDTDGEVVAERDLARQTAERLGIRWQLVDTFGQPLWDRGNLEYRVRFPLGSPEFARMIDFLREVAKTHSILISGEGGDEVMWQPSIPFAGALAREGLAGIVRDVGEARRNGIRPRLGLRNFLKRQRERRKTSPEKPSWLKAPAMNEETDVDPFSASLGFLDHERYDSWKRLQTPVFGFMFEYLHPCFTGVPVEYRWPFLDRDLIELALGLPGYPAFEGKALLRRKMQAVLPQGVIRRPKTGFSDLVTRRAREGESVLPDFHHELNDRFVDPGELMKEARNLGSTPFPRNWMVLRALEVLLWLDR